MDFQFVPDGNRRADRLDRRVGVQVACRGSTSWTTTNWSWSSTSIENAAQ